MSIRYFFFWCERCPTRITVETEAPAAAPYGEGPEYSFAESEWVGLCQARAPASGDDGLERANRCPACAGLLHDLDDLLARQIVPYHHEDSSRLHAAWREKVGATR